MISWVNQRFLMGHVPCRKLLPSLVNIEKMMENHHAISVDNIFHGYVTNYQRVDIIKSH